MRTAILNRRLLSLCGAAVLGAASLLPAPAWSAREPKEPNTTRGQVVHVDDGDTVVMLAEGKFQIKVRLASIDAPESSHENKDANRVGQPYSQNSKRFLSDLIKGRTVEARCYEVDRHGRQVCDLILGDQSVNARMVREGWAWANESSKGRYLRDKSLRQVQGDARAARRGLWAGANPVEPWTWRKTCWEGGQCPK